MSRKLRIEIGAVVVVFAIWCAVFIALTHPTHTCLGECALMVGDQ